VRSSSQFEADWDIDCLVRVRNGAGMSYDQPVKIFISYSSGNTGVAELLSDMLHRLLHYRVEIFRSTDAIDPGTRWQDAIVEALQKSDYLIVILGGQHDQQHSFQGYEIGAFLGHSKDSNARLFAIYDPDAAAPILPRSVQTVAATAGTLEYFLSRLVNDIAERLGLPPNREFQKDVAETANGMVAKFVGGIVSQVLVPALTISVPSADDISKSSILSAPIEADIYTLRLQPSERNLDPSRFDADKL
jgi:hypothetical protein